MLRLKASCCIPGICRKTAVFEELLADGKTDLLVHRMWLLVHCAILSAGVWNPDNCTVCHSMTQVQCYGCWVPGSFKICWHVQTSLDSRWLSEEEILM